MNIKMQMYELIMTNNEILLVSIVYLSGSKLLVFMIP